MRIAVVGLLLVGCGSTGPAAVDASAGDDGGGGEAGGTGTACDPGQFATNVTGSTVTCGPFDEPTVKTTIDARCSIYLGYRDGCDGCTAAPSKWGSSSPTACEIGAGGATCMGYDLDATGVVQTYGVDADGDVDGNDVLYGTVHCIAANRAGVPAPCAPGWYVTGKLGSSYVCSPLAETVVGFIRDNCSVYLGVRDGCDGCIDPPTKWGHAGDGACENGAGADNVCIDVMLGAQAVKLFGLNFDGDVDGNDKIMVGLHCKSPAVVDPPSPTQCPAGSFATGVGADGSLACTSVGALLAQYFGEHCAMFFGWRDSCNGCADPPVKWGRVTTSSCIDNVAADDTCHDQTLGSETVPMYGLSPDGDVNDDDKFYAGFRCQ